MSTERDEPQVQFVLEFEKELIRSLSANPHSESLCGWYTGVQDGKWCIEVFLQSPMYHSGEKVGVRTAIPAFDENLGMDKETYVMVQASGIFEKFVSSSPDHDSRLRYVRRP